MGRLGAGQSGVVPWVLSSHGLLVISIPLLPYNLPGNALPVVQQPPMRWTLSSEEDLRRKQQEDKVWEERMESAARTDDVGGMRVVLAGYEPSFSEHMADAVGCLEAENFVPVKLFGKPVADADEVDVRQAALLLAAAKGWPAAVATLLPQVEADCSTWRSILRRVAISGHQDVVNLFFGLCGLERVTDPDFPTHPDKLFFQALAGMLDEEYFPALDILGAHWGLKAPEVERWKVKRALTEQMDSASVPGTRRGGRRL